MHNQPVVKLLFLTLSLLPGSLFAAEPVDLPHAFEAGWEGVETCELMYETESVRVARCTFPPGIGHEKHYHDPHFGYVLEGGTLSITDASGNRTVTTRSGGAWSSDERTVHEAVNIGETTTSYLIVEPRTR